MDQNTAFRHAFFDEGYCSWKVPQQLLIAGICDGYDLIFEVFGEERLHTVCYLQDVRYVGRLQRL